VSVVEVPKLPLICQGLKAIRRWRRDGSLNVMPLGAAVANLLSRRRDLTHEQVVQTLLFGDAVATERADLWCWVACESCHRELFRRVIETRYNPGAGRPDRKEDQGNGMQALRPRTSESAAGAVLDLQHGSGDSLPVPV